MKKSKKQTKADKAFIAKLKTLTIGTGAKEEAPETFMGLPTKIKCPKCGKDKHLFGAVCRVTLEPKKHDATGEEAFAA